MKPDPMTTLQPNQPPEYHICRWPDGTEKRVVVASVHVIWNEQHAEMGDQGCVVGLEDDVPLAWLKPMQEGRKWA